MSRRETTEVETRPTFVEVLEHLFLEKHTGPVTVQFHQGHPLVVELPAPAKRIALDTGKG